MKQAPRLTALWLMSLLVGVAVFFATCFVEPAETHTLNFGTEYGVMAMDPFGLVGKFPHRLLAPLVAHVIGLGGERYWMFAHGCTTLLISMVFAAAVLRGARWWQALLLTTVIAFTGTIQLYKGHVGYPDPITWLFLMASIVAVRRPTLFWTLQFLNVMNHEQILFFWPWLVYWRRQQVGGSWRPDVIGGVVVLGIYLAWRTYVGRYESGEQLLTMEHYWKLGYFPVGTIGLAALNMASTYMFFGLLPVLVAWHAFADGWKREGFGIALFLLSLHAVFGFAHDVYRFTCFLLVPVFFAGLRLMQRRNGAAILATIGVASVYAIVEQRVVFVKLAIEVMQNLPHPVPAIVPKVIPAQPGIFIAYGMALLATVLGGWLWARCDRRNNALAT